MTDKNKTSKKKQKLMGTIIVDILKKVNCQVVIKDLTIESFPYKERNCRIDALEESFILYFHISNQFSTFIPV